MSADASTKAAPVAAPVTQPSQANKAPNTAPAPTNAPAQSAAQNHQTDRMDRIKKAVETAKSKAEAAKAPPATTQDKPAEAAKATTAETTDKAKPEKVEIPSVIKTDKKEDKPAQVTEADPIDAWKLPDNASPESVKNFGEIRAEAKARKQREQEALAKAADLETQLNTYRNASPADAAATDQLKAQLKEAHDRLAVLDLKSHPDFVQQYVQPINDAIAEANDVFAYSTKEGGELPDLKSLLSKPAKEFNAEVAKLTQDMNHVDANIVMTALRNAHKLNAKQGEVLSKSGELATQLQQKSAQQAKAAFEAVSKDLGLAGDFLQPLEIIDGLSPEDKAAGEAYNASLAGVRTQAEKLAFGRVDEKGVATMAYKAATLDHMITHTIPRVQGEFRKLAQMNKELTEAIASLRGGKSPDVAKGGGGGDGSVDVSKMSVEDRVKYRLAEARRAKQR